MYLLDLKHQGSQCLVTRKCVWNSSKQVRDLFMDARPRLEASEALLHTTSAGTAHKDFSRKVRVAILAARESPRRNAHKQ